ncbi:glycosyltransferase family 4 protein [Kaistia defluvii]|uniref:glycosyltransferase family 4 protein n=1 Tax=Kaistia defluvii TaxID=410841 RepID=UPI0022557933|nr:glycosyltransferase family 4 protein [Kaistia defluvii]MCX5519507.1 glycosyltransferase family 4 protein [Kaistia defluvii]
MMRCLFLTAHPAFPAVTGADLRNWQNASAAAQVSEARLVSVIAGPEGVTSVARLTTSHLGSDAEALYRLPPGSASIDLVIDPSRIEALERVVREFRPDLVVIEHLGLHPFLPMLRQCGARLVLDMHNVESDLAGQISQKRDWFGARRRREQRTVAALEAQVLAEVDAVWVCSEEDAARLAKRGLGPVSVVPNGLPRAGVAPRSLPLQPDADGPELLFIGHLGYTPNVVACRSLARRILPRLRRSLGQARVTLAGRDPARKVRRLARADVRVVANPDDLAPLLRGAHMAIVPLRSGGGTRFKIIEAMAWGIPVVATPLAAEGLGLRDGHDILLAESDDGLASLITALWQDPARRAALRTQAHATAWERFGPERIDQAVLDAMKAVPAR